MNEQYQFTYCVSCESTHRKNYHKEESWLSAFIGMTLVITVIGLAFFIGYLAVGGRL